MGAHRGCPVTSNGDGNGYGYGDGNGYGYGDGYGTISGHSRRRRT